MRLLYIILYDTMFMQGDDSMKLPVKKIVDITKGTLYCGDNDTICSTYTKDTRLVNNGDTYIGIKGANFDGNKLYKEAFCNGASSVIVEKKSFVEEEAQEKPIILVDDSIRALKEIATYIREKSNVKIVGITGSVGKTSTRDMVYSVIKEKYKTLKTEENYNNNIGLPLTLMRINDEDVAVIEMGMNHLGELDYLSKIAKPNIGVITNVGTAHIGELGSRDNILKAKLEILNGMEKDGVLIINNDNDLLHEYYLKNNNHSIITIGIDNKSDVMASSISLNPSNSTFKISYKNSEYNIFCPVPGKAFIYNSLVAFAVAILLDIKPSQIIKGIKNFELTKNRMETIVLKNGVTLINDSYNASVDSMKSSLEILKNYQGKRKIAVLGDMLELGTYSKKLHQEVGVSVANNKIDILVTVGTESKLIASKAIECGFDSKNVYTFKENKEASTFLIANLLLKDVVLFKASNGMKFKEIVNELLNNYK